MNLVTRRPPSAVYRALATAAMVALLLTSCGSEPTASSTTEAGATAETATASAEATVEPSAPKTDPRATSVAVPAALKFSGTTVDGAAFDGASVAGKPTVFWFWAPWCATCRAQISGVSDLASKFGDDISVVGVGALDAPEAIAEFAGTVPGDVTMLSDPDGAVWRHFKVTAQSTYVVLDASGEQQASGFIDTDTLDSTVSSLVSG